MLKLTNNLCASDGNALRRIAALFLVLGTLLIGCKGPQEKAPPSAGARPVVATDPWLLTCDDANDHSPALLWNGLVGFRIARDAAANNIAMYDIDDYDTTGEERINVEASLLKSKSDFDAAKAKDYFQALDMRTGILSTSWGSGADKVQVQTVLDPNRRVISEKWVGKVEFVTGGERGFGWKGGPEMKQRDWGNERTITLGTPPNRNTMLAARGLPKQPIEPAPECPRFDEVAKASKAFWTQKWKTDIEIDGPAEDQLAVHSFLFYLRGATRPGSLMAISPFALGDGRYGGHIFWDADIWIFPALVFTDPALARTIPDYRIAHLAAAHKEFDKWIASGRPTAMGPVPPGSSQPVAGTGAKYPWESSVSGKETVPGPSRFEDHITGSVLWGLGQANALGMVSDTDYRNALAGGLQFWLARSTKTKDGLAEIRGVVSPDENHTGNNDLYTNLLAKWTLDTAGRAVGVPGGQLDFALPSDDTSFLTYDDDPLRSYKQAAAVLSIYPLQYPEAEKEAAAMMQRFPGLVSKNGPAMSDSLHALIWARMGKPDQGYTVWRNSWVTFTDHALMLFSEKRTQDGTYFTTGAGGCLQTVLYGFLGFRIDSVKDPKAAWTKQLNSGRWLSVTPHLPQAWKSVKFKNFTVLGTRYTLTATHQGVQVTPGEK